MELSLLADNLTAAETVARWYFDHWLHKVPGVTVDRVLAKVQTFTSRHSAPMIVLAHDGDALIGAAQLKIREMDIYPDYEFWLGGVYVEESSRGRGVASVLVGEVLSRAKEVGIQQIYLQTENLSGGLYLNHGFKALEEVDYKGYRVLVMVAALQE